jgi:hypothetical protein
MDDSVFIKEVKHSDTGASSAHRWRKCKASIALIAKLAFEGKSLRRSGEKAAEGTVAHTVFAAAMEDGTDGHEFLGMNFSSGGWTFTVDQEMADGVQVMLDFVRNTAALHPDAEIYIEKPLQSTTDEGAFGTPDAIVYIPGKKLIVVDFKYGAGIYCEPDSDQNKYYGYLGIEKYLNDFTNIDVELWIVQPRIKSSNGTVRDFTTTSDELVSWWFKELLPDMQATRDPSANFVIGDHCGFCPASRFCPALTKDVENLDIEVDPSHMTTEEIAVLMEKKEAIKSFLESLAKEAYKRASNGDDVRGFKVVKKKGSKRIPKPSIVEFDEEQNPITIDFKDAVHETFGIEAYEPAKIRSIPQLEKLEGGAEFAAKWGYMPDNGTTLAPVSDSRPAIQRPMDRFSIDEVY